MRGGTREVNEFGGTECKWFCWSAKYNLRKRKMAKLSFLAHNNTWIVQRTNSTSSSGGRDATLEESRCPAWKTRQVPNTERSVYNVCLKVWDPSWLSKFYKSAYVSLRLLLNMRRSRQRSKSFDLRRQLLLPHSSATLNSSKLQSYTELVRVHRYWRRRVPPRHTLRRG